MINLSDIIKLALPFINEQIGEEFSKYDIENQLRENSPQYDSYYMPQIIKKWGIEENEIILIEYVGTDFNSRAFNFQTIEELEHRLLGPSSYLNGFICYVIPVINGTVMTFRVKENKIIWKET